MNVTDWNLKSDCELFSASHNVPFESAN